MKRVLVTSCGANDGCEHYRIREPYSNIKSDKIEFVFPKENVLTDDVYTYDAVVIQRPAAEGLPAFIRHYKSLGKIVVVETDDDLLSLPMSNPAYNYYKGRKIDVYRECLKEASYIHTSTPELSKRGVVFENAINLKKYTGIKTDRQKNVMWSGSVTHKESLLLIKPLIEELLKRNISVTIMSDKTWVKSIFNYENLNAIDWVSIDKYYLMPSLASVFLTPLPNNRFNAAKSELKVIEAAAWGVPCVSSMVAPYMRFNRISNGGNILVKEKPNSWLDAVLSLLEDDLLWKEKSEKSYSAVKNYYNLELMNKKRLLWWEQLLC